MFVLSNLVEVVDVRGRALTPCHRKVAEREVRLQRAKWIGNNRIRLRFDPFAYRFIRLKVLARDSYTCYWCGKPGETIDHIIPWSKGGRTTMTNCVTACLECNGQRGDMPAEEFARLKGVPVPQFTGNEPVPSGSVIRRASPGTRAGSRLVRRHPGSNRTGAATPPPQPESPQPVPAQGAVPAPGTQPVAPAGARRAQATKPATRGHQRLEPAAAPAAPAPVHQLREPSTPDRALRLMRIVRLLSGHAPSRRHLL